MSSAPLALSLHSGAWKRGLAIGGAVFILCFSAGFLSGVIFHENEDEANAASANITVVDNDQIVTEDRGTTTIQKTSTVTVRDASATLGYTLGAMVVANSITGASVAIYSSSSATCTQASPCTLTTNATPSQILETTDAGATNAAGHTTSWTVIISLPGNIAQGSYMVDIAYSEEARVELPVPVLSNLANTISGSSGTTSGGITVNTDINAHCKWRLDSDFTYSSQGTAFTTGQGTTSHATTITGLHGGTNQIYVRCANSTDQSRVSEVGFMSEFITAGSSLD